MITALPDLAQEFEAFERRAELREQVPSGPGAAALWRDGPILCAGTALILAALLIWAFPSADHAERLVRLGASLGFGGAGAVVLSLLAGRRGRTRAEIDTERREIRTYDIDSRGRVFLTGRHALAEMSDISLTDGTFQAHDGEGRVVVSVPVAGRSQMRAIRGALELS